MTRVLLLEDSPDVLFLLQLELEWRGYRVDASTDANAALDTALGAAPDIIVSDLGLPEVDGFEFIRRVRAVPRLASIPAIALTGATLDREIQRALHLGFTTHLIKPVEAATLAEKIEELTARRLKRKAS